MTPVIRSALHFLVMVDPSCNHWYWQVIKTCQYNNKTSPVKTVADPLT